MHADSSGSGIITASMYAQSPRQHVPSPSRVVCSGGSFTTASGGPGPGLGSAASRRLPPAASVTDGAAGGVVAHSLQRGAASQDNRATSPVDAQLAAGAAAEQPEIDTARLAGAAMHTAKAAQLAAGAEEKRIAEEDAASLALARRLQREEDVAAATSAASLQANALLGSAHSWAKRVSYYPDIIILCLETLVPNDARRRTPHVRITRVVGVLLAGQPD